MIDIPQIKFKSMQDYILHIDSSLALCVTKDRSEVENLIKEKNASIVKIKEERNFYGLTDYRIICTSE